jgi:hypothetical protein
MKKIRSFLFGLLQSFTKPLVRFSEFWQTSIQPKLDRLTYALRHNFVYREEGNTIRFFQVIRFKVTRKRRHAFYGYLFISSWYDSFITYLILTLEYGVPSFSTLTS